MEKSSAVALFVGFPKKESAHAGRSISACGRVFALRSNSHLEVMRESHEQTACFPGTRKAPDGLDHRAPLLVLSKVYWIFCRAASVKLQQSSQTIRSGFVSCPKRRFFISGPAATGPQTPHTGGSPSGPPPARCSTFSRPADFFGHDRAAECGYASRSRYAGNA